MPIAEARSAPRTEYAPGNIIAQTRSPAQKSVVATYSYSAMSGVTAFRRPGLWRVTIGAVSGEVGCGYSGEVEVVGVGLKGGVRQPFSFHLRLNSTCDI